MTIKRKMMTKRCLLFPFMFFIVSSTGICGQPQDMDDPLLGISYDLAKYKFEELPRDLDAKCMKGEQNKPLKNWIYASYAVKGRQYYVIAGLRHIEGGKLIGPDFGAVMEINEADKACRALASPDVAFFEGVLEVSDAVIDGLAKNALSRYAAAFGGEDGLRKILAEEKVSASALPPPIRKAFEKVLGK